MESWLRNPWVWAGGAAALIALWYLSSGGSGSSGGTASYSQANLDLVAQQSQFNAAIEQSQIAANTTDTANIAGAITNLLSNKMSLDLGMAQVSAGVQQTQIQADTAKYVEDGTVKINNQNTLRALKATVHGQNAAYNTAVLQSQVAEDIAHQQAATVQQAQTYGFVGNLLSGIGL